MWFPFLKLKSPKRITWREVRLDILCEIEKEPEKFAIIRPFEYEDILTNHKLRITTNPFYTMLFVDEREYYFKRETGEFDGTASPVVEN